MQAQAGYYAPAPSGAHPIAGQESAIEDRKSALFDMVYLVVALNLYVASFLAWPFGIIAGLMLLLGGVQNGTKRVGKTCLIITAVSFVLWAAGALLWFAVFAAAAAAN